MYTRPEIQSLGVNKNLNWASWEVQMRKAEEQHKLDAARRSELSVRVANQACSLSYCSMNARLARPSPPATARFQQPWCSSKERADVLCRLA